MNRDRWKNKTDAVVCSPANARRWKADGNLHLVGVMGFSGAWRRSGLRGDVLRQYIDDIDTILRAVLQQRRNTYQEWLVMCSGATNIGVPGKAYQICAELGITTMGVTAAAAARYTLAPMQRLVPVGRRFGDESHVFVDLCDEFVILGGGNQSDAETRAAHQARKPITVIQGFGGAADQFTSTTLPGAIFIRRGS
ncbi:MAG: hypothetical protein AAFV53_31625 [Myxococcota bacterium]